MVLAVVGACDSRNEPEPSPTKASSTVDVVPPKTVDYESSIRRIPLEGPAASPIEWRLPADLDSEEEAAVLAVRLNLALNTLAESRKDSRILAPLYVAVATDTQLISRYAATWRQQLMNGAGPRQYWLDTPRLDEDGLLHVDVCQDLGWVEGRAVPANVPRPAEQRSEVSDYAVTVPAAFPLRGKVTRVGTKVNAPPYEGPWDRRCASWAQHKPST